MPDRIIVPFDGSELGARALPVADQLATAWDAELVVASFVLAHESAGAQREAIQDQVEALRHRPEQTIVRPVTFTVADEVSDELEAADGGLVVMATNPHPHTAPILGSVAEEILAYTNGPVLLMGPRSWVSGPWPAGTLIVGTDGSQVAERIVSAAIRWSNDFSLPILAMTVARLEDEGRLHGSDVSASEAVDRMAELLGAGAGSTVRQEVVFDHDPAAGLADQAAELDAALIAVATHGASDLRRMVMGSVAMSVVDRAPCPVLVTRP